MFVLKDGQGRFVSLLASIANLVFTILAISQFDTNSTVSMINQTWIGDMGISFTLAYDGISLMMILLTNIAMPLILLNAWNRDYGQKSLFHGLALLMQMALIGVFTSKDGMLFYIFWELALLPIYFISAIWGGENKNRITLKFFIYTFLGSILMLVAMLVLYYKNTGVANFDIQTLVTTPIDMETNRWVFAAFFLAFAIKMPLFPFHTWQPDTYTSAPASGTMLLSGIMLKMGLYGAIRWMLPLSVNLPQSYLHICLLLGVIGIVYASIIAIRQNDMKRLVAYSSIAHVGLIAAGIFTMSVDGLQGALIQMLNHGINVIGLFFAIDIIDRRLNTRELTLLGGLAKSNRAFAAMMLVIVMASVAVPLSNGFTGELLLLKSMFDYNHVTGAIAGITIILCAVYMLRAYQFSMFGPTSDKGLQFAPLHWSEWAGLATIVFLIVWIGVNPDPFLGLTEPAVKNMLMNVSPQTLLP